MREKEEGMEGGKEEEGKSWRTEPIVTAITVVCSQPTDTIPQSGVRFWPHRHLKLHCRAQTGSSPLSSLPPPHMLGNAGKCVLPPCVSFLGVSLQCI